MRNRFDQLAKQIGQAVLRQSGFTVANEEVSPETQHADLRHEPDPQRSTERERLGLLGRFASIPCLIEVYGHAPSAEEFRACLSKHLAFWQQSARRGRSTKRKKPKAQGEVQADPFLWIIAAGTPTTLLQNLRPERGTEWPPGTYFFGANVLRVGLIVASELPKERSTLLVRLMAAGALLPSATEELANLPPDAAERSMVEEILLRLAANLEKQPRLSTEEQEFVMAMQSTWEQARQTGRAEGERALLVRQMRRKFGTVSDEAVQKINQASIADLELWGERVLTAASESDVLNNP